MLNGFWSSRYLEGNFLNRRACTTSPPLPCFSFPRLLSNAVSSCSQWFVSSGGSSCSFCTVISLIVIIRASYLQPWHPLPRETIWAKTEGVGVGGGVDWRNIQTRTKFFDFHVQWCGKYGHMCFTVSHGRSASLCLIISLTHTLAGVSALPMAMHFACQGSMIYACKSNIACTSVSGSVWVEI